METRPSIDANQMNREKRLRPGSWGVWRAPGECHDIGYSTSEEGLRLAFEVSASGGGWKSIRQTVAVVRVPCRLGGERAYFACSGMGGATCGRRAVKLYADMRGFFCRNCLGLAYASQNEDAWDRARRRAQKARLRIGGGPDVNVMLPFIKPRSMQYRKFIRLYRLAETAKNEATEAFIASSRRMLGPPDDGD